MFQITIFSFYKTLPIIWLISHVLLRYESESERVVKDEKTIESIVIIFSMYVNTFIRFKWNEKNISPTRWNDPSIKKKYPKNAMSKS